MGLFSKRLRVHLIIKGRIGPGWHDVDRVLKVPEQTTLADFIAFADARGLPMSEALEHSPHLRDTLMLNGDRCPLAEHAGRVLQEGDQVYLLAPLAGG